MLNIPLSPVPAQNFSIVLDGQNCLLAVYTKLGQIYMDVTAGGVAIGATRLCINGVRVLQDLEYMPFVGDFIFIDMQGNSDPVYMGLGAQYQLIYLEAADVAAIPPVNE